MAVPLAGALIGLAIAILSWAGGVNPYLAAVAGLGAVLATVECLVALLGVQPR